jgi:hypothetical protein
LRTIHRMNRMLPAMAEYRSKDLTLLTPCLRFGGQHHGERLAHERRSRAFMAILARGVRSCACQPALATTGLARSTRSPHVRDPTALRPPTADSDATKG